MNLKNKEYLAKGKRGLTYTAELDGNKVLVKEHNPSSAVDTIKHEADILQRLNPKGIGPNFIAFQDGRLIREFIDGDEFLDWAQDKDAQQIKGALKEVLSQCRVMDGLGISKEEMTRPYKHILMRGDEPVQIDFERAHESRRPQNVTQLCQWITGSRLTELLRERGIMVDKQHMIKLAKTYKEEYTEEAYNAIRDAIGD